MQKAHRHTFPYSFHFAAGLDGHSAPIACKHTVSGSISLPSPGFFSPFPHGTCSLSVIRLCLALEGGPPNFPQDFSCPVVLRLLIQRASALSFKGLSPSLVGLSRTIQLGLRFLTRRSVLIRNRSTPITPTGQRTRALTSGRFRLFPVRSPLLWESRLISFPLGTEMFHFPRFAS